MQTTHGSVRIPIIAEVDSVAGAVQAIRYPRRARFTRVVWRIQRDRWATLGRVHLLPRRDAAAPAGKLTLCGRPLPSNADDIHIGDAAHGDHCQFCYRHEAWR